MESLNQKFVFPISSQKICQPQIFHILPMIYKFGTVTLMICSNLRYELMLQPKLCDAHFILRISKCIYNLGSFIIMYSIASTVMILSTMILHCIHQYYFPQQYKKPTIPLQEFMKVNNLLTHCSVWIGEFFML